jgi:hypothetical protein
MISASVDAPCADSRPLSAWVRMSFAGPGATVERLSISGCVADGPITPRIETSASSAGKIERMA